MCSRFVVGAVLPLILLSGGLAPAQVSPEVELAEAERLFDAFQFDATIGALNPLIERLDRLGDGGAGLLARCYELRGRAAFNLGQVQTAQSDFVSLLEIDASARLPADTSPRLIEFFDVVRSRTVGTLFVTMDPPGRIVIDGREFLLETFNTALDVAAGSHTLVATLSGHRDLRREVVIASGQSYSLDIRLERVFGSLTVATDPSGARISVDGEYVGETAPAVGSSGPSTPFLIVDLAPGQHQLQIDRLCSAPQSVPFNIPDPPVDADIGVIALEPAVATAAIDAAVDGAMVYVDGRLRGRAPARLDDVCAGERVIEVRTRRQRFVDRREWQPGDVVTLPVDFRWGFVLLPSGSAAARDNQVLSRIEAALQDSQRILVISPTAAELDALAAMGGLLSIVTDDLRDVEERRAAGERLTDAVSAQGLAWVARIAGDASDTFSLSLLARGSGVPDTVVVRLADLGSRAAAIRALSTTAPAATRPTLGASLVDVAGVDGAAVVRVAMGGAGQMAGLTVGDVVVGVDGAPAASAGDVRRGIESRGAGAGLRLDVRRQARERNVAVRVTESPHVVPLVGTEFRFNLLLPDMAATVAAARTPLAESAARLNLAVAHIRLRNCDRALGELRQVALPDGPGVSAGTVAYLTALCLLETGQLNAAEASLRRALAAEESVLFVGGPRVASLARQRLAEFFD